MLPDVGTPISVHVTSLLDLPESYASEIGKALLAPILNALDASPSEYYSMWILSVFQHHRNWDHAEDLLRIFRLTSSDAVRWFAALALATSGTRAQALAIKDYLTSASSLCRTAMLVHGELLN
jgi:hypothetical protein